MVFRRVAYLPLYLLLATTSLSPAYCESGQFGKLEQSAEECYEAGDYKKADNFWNRILERLDSLLRSETSVALDQQKELTLRHLGESAMAQKNYDNADDYFVRARALLTNSGSRDSQLESDLKALAKNYRQIDLTQLDDLGIAKPIVTAALNDFHPSKVVVSRLDSGHHISVSFADDIVKTIGGKGLTQFGVSKNIGFDIVQSVDGVVTLANITGVKVRAGLWVNIINAQLKLDQTQHAIAVVTAQKMGISQSVSTAVPDMIYMPVMAVISELKDLFNDDGHGSSEVVTAPQTPNGPVPATTTASVSSAPSASTSTSAVIVEKAKESGTVNGGLQPSVTEPGSSASTPAVISPGSTPTIIPGEITTTSTTTTTPETITTPETTITPEITTPPTTTTTPAPKPEQVN